MCVDVNQALSRVNVFGAASTLNVYVREIADYYWSPEFRGYSARIFNGLSSPEKLTCGSRNLVIPTLIPARTISPNPTATSMPGNRFGPHSGTLNHSTASTIKMYPANLTVADFIAEAEFINPYSKSENGWDYGFLFRRSSSRFDIVIVNSSGRWEHRFRSGVSDQKDETVESGFLTAFGSGAFNTSTRGSNILKLVVVGNNGWLFVNGLHVGTLNLGSSVTSGDVLVSSGYFDGNQVAGAATAYQNFSVTPLTKRHGPQSGSLVAVSGLVSAQSSGLFVKDAVVEARFFNPTPSQDRWSYGFQIRKQGPNSFDAIVVSSNKGQFSNQNSWFHYSRTGSAESSVLLDSGLVSSFNTELRDSNKLIVIVIRDEGWLFVNGTLVSKLNMGSLSTLSNIQAVAGYFSGSEDPGTVTQFQEFAVWSP